MQKLKRKLSFLNFKEIVFNLSLDPSIWIFLCFANAFMLVEVRPQILQVFGPSTWILFICDRKFSLFLYLYKKKHRCYMNRSSKIGTHSLRFAAYHSLHISHCFCGIKSRLIYKPTRWKKGKIHSIKKERLRNKKNFFRKKDVRTSLSWTSWSDRTWYLCIWILLETLPHKSQITRWSTSCTWRMCLAMPFDRIILPHRGQGTFECLIWCSSKSLAVANVSAQL